MRLIILVMLLSGCSSLPFDAPEGTSVVRLSRIQGKVDIAPWGASTWGDTCQLVQIGKVSGCVLMEHDGCSVNTCVPDKGKL